MAISTGAVVTKLPRSCAERRKMYEYIHSSQSSFNTMIVVETLSSVLIDQQAKRADMAAVLKYLGEDWDRDELADALESLELGLHPPARLPQTVAELMQS